MVWRPTGKLSAPQKWWHRQHEHDRGPQCVRALNNCFRSRTRRTSHVIDFLEAGQELRGASFPFGEPARVIEESFAGALTPPKVWSWAAFSSSSGCSKGLG